MAGLADVATDTLENQIRARWGKYGDWKSAGQDQVAALATMLRQNGVTDLSQFQLKARDWKRVVEPGMTSTTGDASYDYWQDGGETGGTTFDAFYGDKQLGFLGDINNDGSFAAYQPKSGDVLTKNGDGTWTTPSGGIQYSKLRGNDVANDMNLLGWSSAGRGNTSFTIQNGPDGQPVVVPIWASSRKGTFDDIRGAASVIAMGLGAGFAGAGGMTGAVAQGALQGAAVGAGGNILLNPNGDVNSLTSGILTGAATGALTGGVKAYGAEQGWNPAVTRAVSSGASTLAKGGDIKDAGVAAITGGANTLASSGGITGSADIDRALVTGATTLARGGSARGALIGGGLNLVTGGSRTGGNNLTDSNDEALWDANIVRFDGGTGEKQMDGVYDIFGTDGDVIGQGGGSAPDEFDFDKWTQDQIDGSNLDTSGGGLSDVVDPTGGLPDNRFNEANTTDPTGGDVDPRTGIRGADGYGTEGLTGEQTAAFDKALQDGTLPDWAKAAAAGFKTAGEFLASPIGKSLLAAGAFKAILDSKTVNNPVDTSRYDKLFENMLSEQALASQRGKDLWADYTSIWRPAQIKFADAAMNFDTPARREQAAQAASAGLASTYDQQRQTAYRDMMASGLDPSTIQALGASSRIVQAKDDANVQNTARNDVEKTGLNLLKGVVDQGNMIQNQATQQSNVATNTTGAASNLLTQQGNVQNQNTQNRNAVIGDLFTGLSSLYGMSQTKTGT